MNISDTHPMDCTCRCCIGIFGQMALQSENNMTYEEKAERDFQKGLLAEDMAGEKVLRLRHQIIEKSAAKAKEARMKILEARIKILFTSLKGTPEFASIENDVRNSLNELNDCVSKRPMCPEGSCFGFVTALFAIVFIGLLCTNLWLLSPLVAILYVPFYKFCKPTKDFQDKYKVENEQYEKEYAVFIQDYSNKKNVVTKNFELMKVFFSNNNLLANVKFTGGLYDFNLKTTKKLPNEKFDYNIELEPIDKQP
jgi:hypothetical protein